MLTKIIYPYVKQAQIDKIASHFIKSNHPIAPIKKFFKIAAFICVQGYKDAKVDINFYRKYSNQANLSLEDKLKIKRIKTDLMRLPPVAILFNLPGGFPLVFIYLNFFTELCPTWVQTDTHEQTHRQIMLKNKKEALNFFMKSGTIYLDDNHEIQTHINSNTLQKMSFMEQKKVAQLCYGIAEDGTNILRYIFKISFPYFMSSTVSSLILQRNLKGLLSLEEKLLNEEFFDGWNETDILEAKIKKQAKTLLTAQHNYIE